MTTSFSKRSYTTKGIKFFLKNGFYFLLIHRLAKFLSFYA